MKCILLFLFILGLSNVQASEQDLIPFETDFCTAYPEGTREQPNLWKHCCIEHDLIFWGGGNLDDRKAADLRLKNCVEKTGAVTQARLIYLAVSLGGQSPIRFKTKQWGNAWVSRERYVKLNESETAKIIQYLETHNDELSSQLKQSYKEQLNSRLDLK